MIKRKSMTERTYQAACDRYAGYCTTCGKCTRNETEPDAERYPCPRCGNDTVYGVEQALLCDYIDIA